MLRLHLCEQGEVVCRGVAFYVVDDLWKACPQEASYVLGVLVGDVPLVGSWVHGDALCAPGDQLRRPVQQRRHVPAAGVPQGGNLVHIDA